MNCSFCLSDVSSAHFVVIELHLDMVRRGQTMRRTKEFANLCLGQRLFKILILVLHSCMLQTSIGKTHVRVVVKTFKKTTGFIMRGQSGCSFGELLHSFSILSISVIIFAWW